MASRASNRDRGPTSEEIGELLDDLEKRMDRCKVLFEQYFLGIQRTAPSQLHTELERKMRSLTQMHIRNTAVRFRFTTLSQKFASYNTYWKRTLRQIEQGTYIRDMARVGRKAARTGQDIPEELLAKMPKRMRDRILRDREAQAKRGRQLEEREEEQRASGKVRDNKPGNVHSLDEGDLDDLDLDSIFSQMTTSDAVMTPTPPPDDPPPAVASARPAASSPPRPTPPPRSAPPPVPRAAAPRPPAPGEKPPPGMSVTDSQALFKQYKKARELVGEDTSNLSYDKLMRSLNKQAPKIMEQHKASGVSFNVVVKGDRVVLKAKPKK